MTVGLVIQTPGSGAQAPKAIFVETPESGVQPAIAGWIGTAGSGAQQFFAALSLAIAPSPAKAFRGSVGPVTANATATESGGVGPFTYAWSQVSGDAMTLAGAASATASFTANVSAANPEHDAVFQCVVTDTDTGATATAQVDVTLFYTGGANS